MVVNLSVDVDSIDLMMLCQELGVLYIDTVIEPWPGFYFGSTVAQCGTHELSAARKVRALGEDLCRRADLGVLLRGQSGHGVLAVERGRALRSSARAPAGHPTPG